MQQFAVAILVGLVERLDQHLDGATHLLAERISDFVLELQGAIEQCGKLFGFIDKEATNAEQMHECLQRDGLLAPDAGIPTGKGGDRTDWSIHQHPAFAIGHQAEAAAQRAANLNHAIGGCGSPTVSLQGGIEIDILRIALDQQ